jgi:hypothetical protein
LFINPTEHLLADFTGQADTSGIRLIGSLHYQKEIIQFVSQFNGNAARGKFIGFRPIKRGTEIRATGSAPQTLIDFHGCLAASQKSVYKQ